MHFTVKRSENFSHSMLNWKRGVECNFSFQSTVNSAFGSESDSAFQLISIHNDVNAFASIYSN